ncbi:MAG: putative toxin-antitoxin system toxin component, PIN family [Planctomycetaceae bacterium]|nr:putative toxin-antitoxin system toxin component, PIN family [Planctomycetaceae bacterium]
MTTRVVFDCMIFLQAAARPASPARACFQTLDESLMTLCVSPVILTEVRDVLSRPELVARFPALSPEWVNEFLEAITSKALVVPDVPDAFSLPRDPKDEPYINLAIATQAEFLVSRDRDLLDLMTDADFRRRFPGLTIVDPMTFLRTIRLRS